jgi:tetratricopeptide (TPR) repeat protein
MHATSLRFLWAFVFSFLIRNNLFATDRFDLFLSEKNIHAKTQKALELWSDYMVGSIDSLQILGVELLKSSTKQNSEFAKAISYRILGCYDVRTGKANRGIHLLTISKNYFVSKNDNEMTCESMNELGIAYFLKGDLETAQHFFEASLEFGNDSPVESNRFLAKLNLAKVFYEKEQFAEAKFLIVEYINQANYLKKWESVSNAYSLLGELALNKDQLRTATKYFEKQIYYAKKTNSASYITRAINNQAIVAYFQENQKLALKLFHQVLERRKEEGFPFNIYDAYFNLSRFYYPNELKIALEYNDSCFQIARKYKLIKLELEVYKWRFEHYKDNQNKILIDSINFVIQQMEKRNESVRNEIINPKKEIKSGSFFVKNQWYLIFSFLIFILFLRYLLIFKNKKSI